MAGSGFLGVPVPGVPPPATRPEPKAGEGEPASQACPVQFPDFPPFLLSSQTTLLSEVVHSREQTRLVLARCPA